MSQGFRVRLCLFLSFSCRPLLPPPPTLHFEEGSGLSPADAGAGNSILSLVAPPAGPWPLSETLTAVGPKPTNLGSSERRPASSPEEWALWQLFRTGWSHAFPLEKNAAPTGWLLLGQFQKASGFPGQMFGDVSFSKMACSGKSRVFSGKEAAGSPDVILY